MDANTTTGEDLVEAAKRLAPVFRERAEQNPDARRVPDESIEDLKQNGLFSVIQSSRNGGHDTDMVTQLDVMAAISEGCTSTAWVVGVGHAHSWLINHLPAEAQDDIYGDDPTQLVSAVIAPRGRAVKVDGGYKVSGFWPFGSGCEHSKNWVLLGAELFDNDGNKLDEGDFVVPTDEIEIRDDWHVNGLKSSGSCSMVGQDIFVPEHRFVSLVQLVEGTTPGRELHDGWLAKAAPVPILSLCIAGSAIGATRAALEFYKELIPGKIVAYTDEVQMEQPTTHRQYASAAMLADEGEMLLYRTAHLIDDYAREGREMEPLLRARCRMDCAQGVRRCLEAVQILFLASGGSGIKKTSRLGTILADLQAANMHGILNLETNQEMYGRVLLGLEPNTPLI